MKSNQSVGFPPDGNACNRFHTQAEQQFHEYRFALSSNSAFKHHNRGTHTHTHHRNERVSNACNRVYTQSENTDPRMQIRIVQQPLSHSHLCTGARHLSSRLQSRFNSQLHKKPSQKPSTGQLTKSHVHRPPQQPPPQAISQPSTAISLPRAGHPFHRRGQDEEPVGLCRFSRRRCRLQRWAARLFRQPAGRLRRRRARHPRWRWSRRRYRHRPEPTSTSGEVGGRLVEAVSRLLGGARRPA